MKAKKIREEIRDDGVKVEVYEKLGKEYIIYRNVKNGRILPFSNPPRKIPGQKNFTTKVREALMRISEQSNLPLEEELIKAILYKAIVEKDPSIIKLVWNYLDGLPSQHISIGKDELPVVIEVSKEDE